MAKEPRPSHEDGKFNPETGDFEDIVDGPGTFGDAGQQTMRIVPKCGRCGVTFPSFSALIEHHPCFTGRA
jgi:hypothetical protein